jgi:two-component system, cell cycle sensor histidine kinase and response regulator CckA
MSASSQAAASRTVLIVDDDPQILRLVEKMLRHKSFKILVAPGPGQALEICGNEPVDLLISDIGMPEMDGHKLAQKVLELRPQASILLISGRYKEDSLGRKAGRVKFLPKPFFPSELLEALRELLPGL